MFVHFDADTIPHFIGTAYLLYFPKRIIFHDSQCVGGIDPQCSELGDRNQPCAILILHIHLTLCFCECQLPPRQVWYEAYLHAICVQQSPFLTSRYRPERSSRADSPASWMCHRLPRLPACKDCVWRQQMRHALVSGHRRSARSLETER